MAETHPRFLVIRLSSIGDIVHTLPAVAALGRSRSLPGAEIHWAIERRFAPLLAGNPFVHRVVELDTLGWRKNPCSISTLAEMYRASKRIRECHYDTAVDFQGLIKTGLLARLAGSQRRVGFATACLRERAAAVFYTHRVDPRGCRHVITLNMALAESLGARADTWEFPLPQNDADDRAVAQQIEKLDLRDYIVISPGGGWKAKRWPPECYAKLIQRLEAEFAFGILLTGSPQEEAGIREILDLAAPTRARYFPSTLVQFIALAKRAKLFIGGDTGPLHLAAAVSTPIVAIFDVSNPLNTPERNGPFSLADITVTGPKPAARTRSSKHRDYLRSVAVDAVLEAVRARWARAYG